MILLTNDDGIDAPGLACARSFLEALGEEIFTVAPRDPMSQCGHSITTDHPLEIQQRGERSWAVGGTPADCVRVALSVLLEERPALVVSGLNYGANLGIDTYVSGTVAAAREAAAHGLPSIALSLYYRTPLDLEADWDATALGRVWAEVWNETLAPGEFWNVNFPDPGSSDATPAIRHCKVSRCPLPSEFRRDGDEAIYEGRFSERLREPGSDVERCFAGEITVSRLKI